MMTFIDFMYGHAANVAAIAEDADFKEEDHPRGGEGSGRGGQFVKSEKTKRKEDEEVDNLSSSNKTETSRKSMLSEEDALAMVAEKLKDTKYGDSKKYVVTGKTIQPEPSKKVLIESANYVDFSAKCKADGTITYEVKEPGWDNKYESEEFEDAEDAIDYFRKATQGRG